jgi:hypothetical protein
LVVQHQFHLIEQHIFFYCYDYNYKGSCSKLNCVYKHACLKCQLQHPNIYWFGNLGQGAYNLNKAQINQKSNQNVNGLQSFNQAKTAIEIIDYW